MIHELIAILGESNVRESGHAVAVFPASTEEIAATMKFCSQRNLIVAPSGGRTKYRWGHSVNADIILHTQRLSGVLDHSWNDLTATVGAGTTWQSMQHVLAQQNQRVALDPLFPTHATVGGILATNDSGTLRLRYGSLRDLVIGMTIVLADGTIARTGGKVVKNVAGYDLPKLLTGSFGTLGIITETTFRLHPIQPHTITFTVRSIDVAVLADLMAAVLRASMSLERMQLRTENLSYALDLQFASMPEVLATQEQTLRALAANLIIESAASSVFLAREELLSQSASTVLKITCLPSKLAAIVAGVAQLNQLPEVESSCIADPVGIVTLRVAAAHEETTAIIDDLRARLLSAGGTVTVLAGGGGADPWGPPPAALDIMRAIKQEFDPARLLNPGKFVGGL